MDFQKLNEISDLKNFISNLRSGSLLKMIESNQVYFQEIYNSVALKAKQSEEELSRQKLFIKQNSNLIERFQNQLQELSNENASLLEKQQALNEENSILREQLQCSEEKFAELDIAYDQQVSLLSEKIEGLEAQVRVLEGIQSQDMNQFDQAQTELHEKIAKSEQLNEDLKKQLETLKRQQEEERMSLKGEVSNLNTLNINLQDKIKKMEMEVNDLQKSLTEAMNSKKQLTDLEMEINKQRYERDSMLVEHQKEKFGLTKFNDELKSKVDDLKKKLLSKEKEIEEVYLRFKELSRFASTIPEKQSMYSSTKRSSTDDPKTIDNSSDSDSSNISFYKPIKLTKRKMESDDGGGPKCYGKNFGNKRKAMSARPNEDSSPMMMTSNQSFSGFQQHVMIPESPYSPVVSSSALTNLDQ